MKRIFVVDEYMSSRQNGVGTFMKTLLESLRATQMEVFLLSYNEDVKELGTCKREEGYTLISFPSHADGNFLGHGWISLALLKTFLPDDTPDNVFLVSHSPCLDFLKTIRKLYPKSKIIFTIHDQGWTAPLLGDRARLKQIMTAKRYPTAYRKAYTVIRNYTREEQRMYALVDRVVCLCPSTERLLQDVYHVPEEKICLIPNGVDCRPKAVCSQEKRAIREKRGIRSDETLLLYAGRTSEAKGILNLLEAFEQAYARLPMLRLVIVGGVFQLNEFCARTPRKCQPYHLYRTDRSATSCGMVRDCRHRDSSLLHGTMQLHGFGNDGTPSSHYRHGWERPGRHVHGR